MKFTVITDPGRDWDIFTEKYSPFIYHRSIWVKVLKQGFKGEILYFALEDNRRIAAGVPGFIMQKLFIKIYFSSIPFGGFIGDKKYFPLLKEKIEEYLKKSGISQIRIFNAFLEDTLELEDYDKQEYLRILLNTDQYRKNRNKKEYFDAVRRRINRGLKMGARVVHINKREEAEELYNLYLESMRRKGLPAKYSKRYIYAIYDFCVLNQTADIVFVLYKNVKIAGMAVLYSKGYAHMMFSGFIYNEREISGNDILIDYFLQNKKIDVFDFMLTPREDSGLIRFKSKWGSDIITSGVYMKDIKKIPCLLWNILYRMVNTRPGAWITRLIRK